MVSFCVPAFQSHPGASRVGISVLYRRSLEMALFLTNQRVESLLQWLEWICWHNMPEKELTWLFWIQRAGNMMLKHMNWATSEPSSTSPERKQQANCKQIISAPQTETNKQTTKTSSWCLRREDSFPFSPSALAFSRLKHPGWGVLARRCVVSK